MIFAYQFGQFYGLHNISSKRNCSNSRFQWSAVLNIHSKTDVCLRAAYVLHSNCNICFKIHQKLNRNKYKFKSNSEWNILYVFSARLHVHQTHRYIHYTFSHQTVTACDCSILFNWESSFIHTANKCRMNWMNCNCFRSVYSTLCVAIRVERWLKCSNADGRNSWRNWTKDDRTCVMHLKVSNMLLLIAAFMSIPLKMKHVLLSKQHQPHWTTQHISRVYSLNLIHQNEAFWCDMLTASNALPQQTQDH